MGFRSAAVAGGGGGGAAWASGLWRSASRCSSPPSATPTSAPGRERYIIHSSMFLDWDLISLLYPSTNLRISYLYVLPCDDGAVCLLVNLLWTSQNKVHRKYPRILGHEAAGCVILILFSTHALQFFFFWLFSRPLSVHT